MLKPSRRDLAKAGNVAIWAVVALLRMARVVKEPRIKQKKSVKKRERQSAIKEREQVVIGTGPPARR